MWECLQKRSVTEGEALENFPQAFSRLALINAACRLDRALGEEKLPPMGFRQKRKRGFWGWGKKSQ
jgi:hypothetical protein